MILLIRWNLIKRLTVYIIVADATYIVLVFVLVQIKDLIYQFFGLSIQYSRLECFNLQH